MYGLFIKTENKYHVYNIQKLLFTEIYPILFGKYKYQHNPDCIVNTLL